MVCNKCGGNTISSKALLNSLVGFNDFGNDAGSHGTTQSRVGSPNLVSCQKCSKCGHSFIPLKEEVIREEVTKLVNELSENNLWKVFIYTLELKYSKELNEILSKNLSTNSIILEIKDLRESIYQEYKERVDKEYFLCLFEDTVENLKNN